MNQRLRIFLILGCVAVVVLHAPRCLESLVGPTGSGVAPEAGPAAVAALDGARATERPVVPASGARR